MPAPRILKPSSGTKRSPTRRRRLSFSPDVLVTSLDLRKSKLVPLEGEPPREDPLVALDLKGKLERASSPPATKHQAAPAAASPNHVNAVRVVAVALDHRPTNQVKLSAAVRRALDLVAQEHPRWAS